MTSSGVSEEPLFARSMERANVLGLKIAAQTRSFAQSIKKALHTAAGMGCDGVQIDVRHELPPAELSDTGVRQMRKMLDDLNLRVGSLAFPTRRGYANPADLQPRLEAARAAMQMASRLGCRVLVGNLGTLPDCEDVNGQTTLRDALLSLGSYGDHVGVRFAVQTSTPASKLVEWIATLPAGTLWLDLHPARLIAQGASPAEFVRTAGQYIVHVHAVDGVYDVASGQGVEVELGRGTADFPELFGLLEEHGYRDWLTLERRQSKQPIEDIANGVKYLRSLG